MINYVISEKFISLVIDNEPFNIFSTHRNFDVIKKRLKNEDYKDLIDLINESKSIEQKFIKEEVSDLTIENNRIYYKGNVVDNSIVNQIIETKNQGYKFDNLLKFLENLLENTSYSIVTELYDWISSSKTVSITEDGAFLAYKKVNERYYDIFSDTMNNSVGQIVEMERNEVDDNRQNTCSNGLHFCSYNYLNEYGRDSETDKVVIVKVFPSDVISIPTDYNFQKGRCCKYEVVSEVERWRDEEVLTKSVDDYEEEDCVSLFADDIDLCSKDEITDEETIDFIIFTQLIDNLTTCQMTKIYNSFYDKTIHHIRTKSKALEYMKEIYDKDYMYFLSAVDEMSSN